jgi:hypothetical protein
VARWKTGLVIGTGAVAMIVASGFAVLINVFGLSGSYQARDGDVHLTRVARGALPLIDAIERYRKERAVYPDSRTDADMAALAPYLPGSVKVVHVCDRLEFDGGSLPRWIYSVWGQERAAYSLSIKLGWDPRLSYRREASGAQWVFEPGDGSKEKVISLRP